MYIAYGDFIQTGIFIAALAGKKQPPLFAVVTAISHNRKPMAFVAGVQQLNRVIRGRINYAKS